MGNRIEKKTCALKWAEGGGGDNEQTKRTKHINQFQRYDKYKD